MIFSTKNLISTSLVLLISAPAFAGTSLSSLLSGDSLTSNNGKLVFSGFAFTPGNNAPAAAAGAIDVTTLDKGLLFGSPVFIDSATGIVNFDVAYKVTAIDSKIISAAMQTNAKYSGDAQANAIKVIKNASGVDLAILENAIATGNLSASDSAAFAALADIGVSDSFSAFGGGGSGANGSVEVIQTFETIDDETSGADTSAPTAAPSPTAALGGLALLGLAGMRRRRS